ncbi:MAG: hypothetical protein ACUVQD_01075 [Thermaceae bacterium]
MRWRLDRVILQGFKSFLDRTLLDFTGPAREEGKALFFGGEEGRVLEVRLEFFPRQVRGKGVIANHSCSCF